MFGLETEYSVAPRDPGDEGADRDAMARWLMERAYDDLPSVRHVGGQGLFLASAAKIYVDAGHHPEVCTPELTNPWDAVRYVVAGERIFQRIGANPAGAPSGWINPVILKTNVDYASQTTWGTHESYLVSRATCFARLAAHLMPHLVSRVLYTGAGGWNAFSRGLEFVVSPRACFTAAAVSGYTTSDPGIVSGRDEPLSAAAEHRRLHIVCGESLNSHTAMWLRSATTALVVALIDHGVDAGEGVLLVDPVAAFRAIAADPTCTVRVPVGDGRAMTALEIQRHYLACSEAHGRADFMPDWAPEACRHWRAMLDRLEQGPDAVGATLDWAIKRRCFLDWAGRRHGFDWAEVEAWTTALNESGEATGFPDDLWPTPSLARRGTSPARGRAGDRWEALIASGGLQPDRLQAFLGLRATLLEADLRFGQVGDEGLFTQLDRAGILDHRFEGADNFEHAMWNPPARGRAHVRGAVIHHLLSRRTDVTCEWDAIYDARDNTCMELSDPRSDAEAPWLPAHGRPSARLAWTEYANRATALRCYEQGDHARAEQILRELVAAGFELTSTRCHLARVLVMQDRLDEARAEVELAWSVRSGGATYAVRRLLWFRALFAALENGDPSVPLGQLKSELGGPPDCVEWAMGPLLAHVDPRLDLATHHLLTLLAHVLGGEASVEELDALERWRECVPVALE